MVDYHNPVKKEGHAVREISCEAENNEGEVNLTHGDAEEVKKHKFSLFPIRGA